MFPTLRGTSLQALAPLTLSLTFDTYLDTQQNGSEQRWPNRGPLWSIGFPANKIIKADKNSELTFFINAKGRMATNLNMELTFQAGTFQYNNLSLNADTFESVESETTQYSTTIGAKQTVTQPLVQNSTLSSSGSPQTMNFVNPFTLMVVGAVLTVGVGTGNQENVTVLSFGASSISAVFTKAHAPGEFATWVVPGSFPSINRTLTTQLPYSVEARMYNDVLNSPDGERFAFAYYDGGLTNFPTGPLYTFKSQNSYMSDADMWKLFGYFMACQGRYAGFTFPDPETNSNITNCHFGSDTLTAVITQPGINQVNFEITNHF